MTEVSKIKQEAKEVATFSGDWGASQDFSTNDILLPKVLLMQALSGAVVDGKAASGDLIDSVSLEVLLKLADSKQGKSLEIVPISVFKTWVNEKFNGKKWEYFSVEPINPGEDKLPWDYVVGGEKFRRNYTINTYFMIASQCSDPSALPYVASFRRTSLTEGKKITTQIAKASMNRPPLPPFSKTILLSSKSEAGEDGTYQTFQVASGRMATTDEMTSAFGWYQQIKKGMTKVDESDLQEEVKAPSQHIGF